MYSVRFKIKFNGEVSHIERMRILCELLELPQKNGIEDESLYWYKIKHNGLVSFWSAKPDLTHIIESWLNLKVDENKLICLEPKRSMDINEPST